MVDVENQNQRIDKTVEIVAAYVSHNAIALAELPALLDAVFEAIGLVLLGVDVEQPPLQVEPRKPAVPIKKSIHDEFIICLENGRRFKTLKRHLSSYYGLSPEAYRVKWGLPSDYPMVAPAYASKRSDLARQSGLGRNPDDRSAASPLTRTSQAGPQPRSSVDTETKPSSPSSRRKKSVAA